MKTETRYIPLNAEIRAATDDQGQTALGLAIPYDSWSVELGDFREKILAGAFTNSLAEASAGERNIYHLWSHDNALPLGSTKSGKLKLEDRQDGLYFELDTTRMNALQIDAVKDGDLRCSFGFITRHDEWKDLEDGSYERTIHEGELLEISFVTSPAYPATEASMRSQLEEWRSAQTPTEAEQEPVEKDLRNVEMLKQTLRAKLKARGL